VRDDRFEVIGVAVKVNDGETEWASGTHEQIKDWLESFDWENSMAIAHNMMFDGFILSERFGIFPKVYADTLSMGRAIHGVEVGASLAALAERYKLGTKGDEVIAASGKNRADFTDEELLTYMKIAHERDVTFNQLIEDALRAAIKGYEIDPQSANQQIQEWLAREDWEPRD
jgi:hypothetical protein